MPKGYWIPHLDVSNMQGFQAYRDMADAATSVRLEAPGARRPPRGVEGKMRARNVLREFNSLDEALAYYHGPDYSARASAARAAFGLRFPDRRGLRRPAAAADRRRRPRPAALKGYWLVHVDVTDPEGYKPYQAANAAAFSMFGARFLVRGGRSEITEGAPRSRAVVLEFPSYEAALGCYRSPEYQARRDAARTARPIRYRRHRGLRRQRDGGA